MQQNLAYGVVTMVLNPNLMSFIQNILLPRYAGLPICKILNIMKIWKDMGAIILGAMIECNNLSISINVIPNIIGIRW